MRDISLHLLDIAQNSVKAKSRLIQISMHIDAAQDSLTMVVSDDGCGMSRDMLERVRSPFVTSRTTRNVGLGIPLLAASCENTGGRLDIESKPGNGTRVTAVMGYSHIDRPPLGDIAETVASLIISHPDIDFVFRAEKNDTFEIDTRQIKQTLGDVSITEPQVTMFIREYLQEGIKQVFGGNEV